MLLKSSNTLYSEAGENGVSHQVRRGPRYLDIGQRSVQLRDQDPLHAGKISFRDGWTLDDLVRHLDDHVFFWPGWDHGPVLSGRNHFARYAAEQPVVLRVATAELVGANPGNNPLFCRYNSGAPRCTQGYGSPRGKGIFLRADDFPLSPSNVVEVTFRSSVVLPISMQKSGSLSGPWEPLRCDGAANFDQRL